MRQHHDDDRPLFMISVAAELAGMHPQTLRLYERRGLVRPQRTAGKTRRYSERDVERLQRIQELTELGLNLAGVERVLAMEEQLDAMRRQMLALQTQLDGGRRSHAPRGGARRALPPYGAGAGEPQRRSSTSAGAAGTPERAGSRTAALGVRLGGDAAAPAPDLFDETNSETRIDRWM